MKPIHGKQFIDALIAAGIVPQNCCHVVIDADMGDAARVYFECIGDERLLGVVMPENFIEVKK